MSHKLFLILLFVFVFKLSVYSQFDDKYYDGPPNKCGTFHALHDKLFLQRHLVMDSITGRPKVGQKKLKSPSGKFLLHYDTVGVHKVPIDDLNKNGISDYIDSASYHIDFTYKLQVEELGYRTPYPDDGEAGDEYDIYFYDLGNSDDPGTEGYEEGGYYGATVNVGDSYHGGGKFFQTHSYMIVDNDFSVLDSVRAIQGGYAQRRSYNETGILALKITLAHEFQHAIQFITGLSSPSGATIMEMCATSMEFRHYPESKDYLQWVKTLFKNLSNYSIGDNNPSSGYCYAILPKFLIEKYDQNAADRILKRLWDNVYLGKEVYSAFDASLKVEGTDLKQTVCELFDWMYYTGSRTVPGMYFQEAKELPEIKFYSEDKYKAKNITTIARWLLPLELRAHRIIFPGSEEISGDTLDILLTDLDVAAASATSKSQHDYILQIADTLVNNNYKPLEGINYFMNMETAETCISLKINSGGSVVRVGNCYPNPVIMNNHKNIFFPVPQNAVIGSKVVLTIYNSDMIPVSSKLMVSGINYTNLIVNYDVNWNDLAHGIYFFSTEYKSEKVFGKFAVISR